MGATEQDSQPEIDHEYTDNPVCPYCGYVCGDTWELDFGTSEETTVTCCECERDYIVSAHFSVNYSTRKSETKETTSEPHT